MGRGIGKKVKAMRGRKEEALDEDGQIPSRLGETIRAWRRYYGLSVTDLAVKAGFEKNGRSYISKIEHGYINRLSDIRLDRIAEALNLSSSELRSYQLPVKVQPDPMELVLSSKRHVESRNQRSRQVVESPSSQDAEIVEIPSKDLTELFQMAESFYLKLRELIPTERHGSIKLGTSPTDTDAPLKEEDKLLASYWAQNILRKASFGRVPPELTDMPDKPEVIQGNENVLRFAIKLLDEGQTLTDNNTSEILINFQGNQDIFDISPKLRREWWRLLKVNLERGSDVIHLMRLSDDRGRIWSWVADMLELLGLQGSYQPYYFPLGEPAKPSHDFILVYGKGALEFISSDQQHLVDTAFFYPMGEHFEVLRGEFARLRNQCHPLLSSYEPRSIAFDSAVRDKIEQEGDRFLVMDGLSEVTAPAAIHEDRARPILERGGEQAEIALRLIENRRRREVAFKRQIKQKKHLFRDICPKGAIERLVKDGITASDDRLFILGGDSERLEQRVEHLKNVIDLLETSSHYELGLLDDEVTKSPPTFWLVKGGHAVFFETWPPNASGDKEELDLEITEPSVVEAFHEYFLQLWEQLPAENRDKHKVISWLRKQIAQIPLVSG
jgi:transcriptional regulator with XRE-family HTH domain